MPVSPWSDENAYNPTPYEETDPIGSLITDLSYSPEAGDQSLNRGIAGRRRKAALVLTAIWSGTIALHLLSWGSWLVLTLSTLLGIHILRIVWARPTALPEPLTGDDESAYPYVSLMVAAKNEEAVIGELVKSLCNLDYPACRYDLWVIDDNSTDRTPIVLDKLAEEYQQLKVIHRSANAGGGKSGALNQVWPVSNGEIFAVFDADAQVNRDMLRRVLPLFQRERVGAVQLRKAIVQSELGHPLSRNFWIQGQMAEMALDSYLQQQRIAIGGVGELRGNGQFVRRTALEDCGGWNEETITDDLDLTFRLHLKRWEIDFMLAPPVREEGVTRAVALWHQRNRWAEGGYQRYLDYWRLLARNRMGFRKTFDVLAFWLIQYGIPTAAVPDFLMAIVRNRPPMLAPLTGLSVMMSLVGFMVGMGRVRRWEGKKLGRQAETSPLFWLTLLKSLRGVIYMFHWLPVVSGTTARISFRPKRLKWVKTVHHGTSEVWMDMTEESEKTA
ncbi:MAG: glycosyltransferase family 2 protein [Leptolyngbyaceae cyanobacterium bins.59]|nr:glycosyltransferase family 2 protein [Leptolyngbyaceae cyanobacterium bins.59]